MTPTEQALQDLQRRINAKLDALHDALIARIKQMARSVGQRTRIRSKSDD